LIGAIILGLLAGFIGKAISPGKDPGGFFATIIIGLAGAVIGYLIFNRLLGIGDSDIFDLGGLLGAIIGVVILLFGYRKLVESRGPAPTAAPRTADDRAASRRERRDRPRKHP
jgi:uncharacterized membrane protein YeaQ/YmgE (transglycosylase-associated protein family)